MRLMLAPHHDDVLLSIPELLLAAKGSGDSLVVVVFSDEDPALEQVCAELHRKLGLPTVCLGFPEARKRGLRNRQILRSRRAPGATGDDPLLIDVCERLRNLCTGETTVLAPLTAVHIDHALVRDAARRIASEWAVELIFYADEPYVSIWHTAGELARRELQVVPVAAEAAASTQIRSLLAPLTRFVGERDLDRLQVARERRSGVAAPLWRSI
jgi:hypothetical protein